MDGNVDGTMELDENSYIGLLLGSTVSVAKCARSLPRALAPRRKCRLFPTDSISAVNEFCGTIISAENEAELSV